MKQTKQQTAYRASTGGLIFVLAFMARASTAQLIPTPSQAQTEGTSSSRQESGQARSARETESKPLSNTDESASSGLSGPSGKEGQSSTQSPGRSSQGQSSLPNPEARPPFKNLRQEEDWRFLRNLAKRTDWWDSVKYIPLGKNGWLTLNGQTRQFYEYIGNENWGASRAVNNQYWLQRYHLGADFHFSDTLRLYAELKSGLEIGRKGGPRPMIDQDDADTHQLFLEIAARPRSSGQSAPEAGGQGVTRPSGQEAPLVLRVGRQELSYGAERLIAVREGPNVRQSFDGLFGIVRSGAWRIDAFTARPVLTNPRTFDDGTDYAQMLWAVYATGPLSAKQPKGASLDLYYIGQDRRGALFDQGKGNERRHTLGFRLWSKNLPFDYDFEPNYQLGTFGDGAIRAWGAAFNVGYTVPRVAQNIRIGLSAGANSGDRNPNKPGLETYSPPAPSGRYFGQIPSIGPQNVIGFSPSLALQPVSKLTLTISNYFFWRQSASDGIYALSGIPLKTGKLSRERYIGTQPEFSLLWQIDPHASLILDYANFLVGSYLRETPPGKNIHYFGAWFTYLF